MKYRVSKDAHDDLDAIFVYWAERAGVDVADRLIDSIAERFWLIGEHPNAGHTSEATPAGVKCFPAGKYLIYYRKTKRVIEILHVFHGARDQRNALRQIRKR